MHDRKFVLIACGCLVMWSVCFGRAIEVGDAVWAQWKPNAWYHGKLTEKTPVGFHVAFDDGDQADLPPALIVADHAPSADQVQVGTRVLALWTGGKYYPGTVTKAGDGGKYAIQFDDGDSKTVELAQIRSRGPARQLDGDPKVGDVVWAQWKPNAWYHGKLTEKTPVDFHVSFDDGDQADLPSALIVVDRAASANQVQVGTRVLALWTDGKYYPGTVAKAGDKDQYDIRFDDGDSRAVDAAGIRLLSE